MLTLAIGDIYIPDRAFELPLKFRKLLCANPNTSPTNNKLSNVLCLGNINNSFDTLKFLYDLSPSFNIVRGEFDEVQILSQQIASLSKKETKVPAYKVIQHDNLKIGFTNGYLVMPKNDPLTLLTFARELDLDILILGGTHKVEAYTLDGKFFVNPGSATGAYTFDWQEREDESEDDEGDSKEQNNELMQQENELKTEDRNGSENKDAIDEIDSEKKEVNFKDNEKSDVKTDSGPKDVKNEAQRDKEYSEEVDTDLINEIKEHSSFSPSFCLLDTQDSTCTLYIYTYFHGEVKVDKVIYQKE